MPLPMVKIPGVPDKKDVRPGMAYFAGTGPKGMTCGKCDHRGYNRQTRKPRWNERSQREEYRSHWVPKCSMFRKMTGKNGGNIDKSWPACKYFKPRAKENR